VGETDNLDHHWATLNLMKTMEDLNLCAKRLRTIASQKSVPKPETIKRWVSFGELHRENLEAQLKQVKSDKEFIFIELIDGAAYSDEKTARFIHMFELSIDFYKDARNRALKRLKKPKKQFFAGS
jgi:hypothetical protein